MKAAFWVGLLLGFTGIVAAAHFVPWIAHTRVASHTSVVANGGRAEQFVIRLPVDRVAAAGASGLGIRAASASGAAALPPSLTADPLLVEHFKVRDSANNVIGIAARHWTAGAIGGTAWSVLIPSRGALLLTADGEARGAVDTALKAAGYVPGKPWTGDVKVALTPKGETGGVIAAGSEEFDGLDGRYAEVWTITGVDETGALRGTIELDTVTHRS
jgi:hypothetical protein